eukprot:scaffold1172_cov180-Ochromonas_danica.AAC.13
MHPSHQIKEQEVLLTVTENQINPDPLPQAELDALYDLYNATHGEYWIWTGVPWNFTKSNPDPCSEGWQGIACFVVCHKSSSCEEHVYNIILSNNNMSGSLPDSLKQIEYLGGLTITVNNGLTGTISPALFNLSYLSILSLSSNSLSGSIPSTLTNAMVLTNLDFSGNYLTGSLPENISQLILLETLYIYSNLLTGSIPGDIGSLSRLSFLSSYSNLITGKFPDSIANCSLMQYISMEYNFMTSHLPVSVGNLKSVTYLGVMQNMLTGSLPDDIGLVSALLYLDLEKNFFSGILPSSIGQLSALLSLSLYENILSGTIPSTMYELSGLELASLSNNALSGSLDGAIGQWISMYYMDISTNRLTGSLPAELGQLENMEVFIATTNTLSGTLPAELGNWKQIVEIYLGVNWLEGTLPVTLGNMSMLQYLYLENCLFTGVLSMEMASLKNLLSLGVAGNLLSGSIPSFLANITSLALLSMGFNYFYGSLPGDFGRLANLEYLDVGGCGCSGSLPASFSSLTILQAARLDTNFLSGPISALSIQSNRLEFLNISCNFFTGETSPLMSLHNISILDISSNGLTGPFQVHETMPKLVWLFLRGNELSGSLPGTFTSLTTPSLLYLDLSNNRFSGAFPASDFAQLTKLNTLAAVENCFTGTISSDLCKASKLQVAALDGLSAAPSCRKATLSSSDGVLSSWAPSYIMGRHAVHGSLPSCLFQELKVLVTLHLSGNSLTGTIPDLAENSLLSDLSLSHNELTGTVPDSVQSNPWVNLDLSFNKLTGILKSSSSYFHNASIALDINRLSGKIPADYYHMADVDILRGNIFQCQDESNSDKESLPPNDPYKSQYGCGSVTLNTSLIICVVIIGSLLVVSLIVLELLKRRRKQCRVQQITDQQMAECFGEKQEEVIVGVSGSGEAEKHDAGSNNANDKKGNQPVQPRTCCERLLDKVEMLLKQIEEWQTVCSYTLEEISTSKEAKRDRADPSDFSFLRSQIVVVGQLSRLIRQFSVRTMLLIVLLGVPLYITLSSFYGSYDHQYAWTPSAAFLSGQSAAIALLILFLGLTASLAYFRAYPGSSFLYHAGNRQNGHHLSIMCWWYGLFIACQNNESWCYFLRVLVIAVGNITIVMVVNATYVYLYLQVSVLQAFFLSVAMTGFKVVWSRILFLVLSRWIAQARERGRKQEALHPSDGSNDNTTNTIDGVKNNTDRMTNGWNSATITIYSCLMLFNTIVAPCLATLLVSSDCFYYVFVSPPYITVSYTYPVCVTVSGSTCVSTVNAVITSDFQPPFSYGYQCSSALLQEYGYVFVYKYLLLGVLYPVVVLLLTFYHDQQTSSPEHETNSKLGVGVSDDFVSPLHSRSGDSVLDMNNTSSSVIKRMRSSSSFTSSALLPPLWKKNVIEGLQSYFLGDDNFEHVFSAAEYSVRLTMMMGTLLTFGMVLPYLAVLVCLAIVTNTYLTQWALARFYLLISKSNKSNNPSNIPLRLIHHTSKQDNILTEVGGDSSSEIANNLMISFSPSGFSSSSMMTKNQNPVVQHVSKECQELPAALLVSMRPLSVLMLVFLSCFLFDIAGDKEGAWVGFYFVLVMCLVPLLALIVHRLWLAWMDHQRMIHNEKQKINQTSRTDGDNSTA